VSQGITRMRLPHAERKLLAMLVEVAVDKNSTVVFPAPLMSTIGELGAFLAREKHAADRLSEDGALAPRNGQAP
jgi:hypothetical protein